MELSRCSRASVKSGSYFRPVPKHFVRVPVLVFFLGFRKGAVGGVADDVFDAEKLRVGSGAIEEHALEHVVVAGAGVAGAVVLDGEDELRVVLGGMDAAEVDVVSGQRRGAGLGIASSHRTSNSPTRCPASGEALGLASAWLAALAALPARAAAPSTPTLAKSSRRSIAFLPVRLMNNHGPLGSPGVRPSY